MAVLNHLEPQRVFRFFEELCAIPHGSGNTKAVSDWLVDFAKARGLRYVQDQLNNVVIFRDATPGYESAEPVIFVFFFFFFLSSTWFRLRIAKVKRLHKPWTSST